METVQPIDDLIWQTEYTIQELERKLLREKEKLECLHNKDKNSLMFPWLRYQYYKYLHEKIPTKLGNGNEKWRAKRDKIREECKLKLEAFDKAFDYVHINPYEQFY